MAKSVHPGRRRRASTSPARRDAPDARPLLDRLLDTPHLALIVPQLQPEALHRVIEACGLEACGEIVALATPEQLAHVFDLDLWRAEEPGLDAQFDADRFGVWLDVMVESGADVAAKTLAGVDANLVIAALAHYVLVVDPATVMPVAPADGDEVIEMSTANDGPVCRIGGYLVVPKRSDSWDAILAVLPALDMRYPDYFHRVMRGCRGLSNSTPEIDGLDDLLMDGEQAMFNLAVGREKRREQRGYVTPAQAHAFLKMSREFSTAAGAPPQANVVTRAYFRAIEETPTESGRPSAPDVADAAAAVAGLLLEAGVVPEQPRALLGGTAGTTPRLARIQALMQMAGERDYIAYMKRTEELAYLANAIVAGCSIQARPFTVQEASDAAVAVCNLGLENWPANWLQADLVTVFQIGWSVLYHDVCMYTAEQLIAVLKRLKCEDREIRSGLIALRVEMTKQWKAGEPWRARDALDVIETLDMPAWAALLGLIDGFPVMHAGLGASRGARPLAVSATAFEFISENSQIAAVREFMLSLPGILA